MIERFHHGTVIRISLPLQEPAFRIFWVVHPQFLTVFSQEFLTSWLQRRMNQPTGIIKEKRWILIFTEKSKSFLGHMVPRESVLIQSVRVFPLLGSKTIQSIGHSILNPPGLWVTGIMTGKIKSLVAWLWKGIMLDRNVPLPYMASSISIQLQSLGNGNFFCIHTSTAPGSNKWILGMKSRERFPWCNRGTHSTCGMLPTHDRTSTRATNWRRRVTVTKKYPTLG